jgi:ABC-2 type transport system ATP-binding protein
MLAIETHDLRKVYVSHKKQPGVKGAFAGLFSRQKTEVEAVKGISLSIELGELVGFLGPNGAGKTTTLKMLTGILYPTSGEARVLGFKPFDRKPEMLRDIAFVVGNKQQLWWDLPAWDSFLVLKELYEIETSAFDSRANELIDMLQIRDKIHTQMRKLSLGERMKCELVAALLHSPKVVFLDEPTLGLDVVSQKRIREFLKQYHSETGCTIILTSHYMLDVQELCDRVIVIDHGTQVFDGTLDELSRRFSDTKQLRLTFDGQVPEDLSSIGRVLSKAENVAVIEIPRSEVPQRTAQALQAYPVEDLAIEEVPIEDVIADLFGRQQDVSRETSSS